MIGMGRAIIEDVARSRALSVAEICSSKRFQPLIDARREAARRMRVELGYSFPRIGRLLHRCHTTIVYMLSERSQRRKHELYKRRKQCEGSRSTRAGISPARSSDTARGRP